MCRHQFYAAAGVAPPDGAAGGLLCDLYFDDNSVYSHVPISAMTVPTMACVVRTWLKKTTDEPMMATRFTTLHTPCETGLTRCSVLNANCARAGVRAVCGSEQWG
jgi:hypothetical protein